MLREKFAFCVCILKGLISVYHMKCVMCINSNLPLLLQLYACAFVLILQIVHTEKRVINHAILCLEP